MRQVTGFEPDGAVHYHIHAPCPDTLQEMCLGDTSSKERALRSITPEYPRSEMIVELPYCIYNPTCGRAYFFDEE